MTRLAPLSAGTAPDLVTLTSAPLRHVLCVMQFAPILKISDPSGQGVAKFQDHVRSTYPIFRSEQQHELRFEANEAGQVVNQPSVISHPAWIFADISEDWIVTLTHQSLAIQTSGESYAGRNNLINRFGDLLDALHASYSPVVPGRLGFRYVNLFEGDLLAGISKYTNPAMIGFGGRVFGNNFESSFGQTEGSVGASKLIIKTGRLKPGTVGEMITAPLADTAWLLDIDAAQMLTGDTSSDHLRDIAVELTNLNCQMFRWAISDEFLQEYRRG
jgi:uncharacterized protein (TIGR04255 family)